MVRRTRTGRLGFGFPARLGSGNVRLPLLLQATDCRCLFIGDFAGFLVMMEQRDTIRDDSDTTCSLGDDFHYSNDNVCQYDLSSYDGFQTIGNVATDTLTIGEASFKNVALGMAVARIQSYVFDRMKSELMKHIQETPIDDPQGFLLLCYSITSVKIKPRPTMPEVVSFENLNLFRCPQPTQRNVLEGSFTDGESISSNVADGLETVIARQIILANVVVETVKVITKRTCATSDDTIDDGAKPKADGSTTLPPSPTNLRRRRQPTMKIEADKTTSSRPPLRMRI
nr:aspartic proteinase CDR1-like [Ipomoea batatas]